jgi:hypothetical protein
MKWRAGVPFEIPSLGFSVWQALSAGRPPACRWRAGRATLPASGTTRGRRLPDRHQSGHAPCPWLTRWGWLLLALAIGSTGRASGQEPPPAPHPAAKVADASWTMRGDSLVKRLWVTETPSASYVERIAVVFLEGCSVSSRSSRFAIERIVRAGRQYAP